MAFNNRFSQMAISRFPCESQTIIPWAGAVSAVCNTIHNIEKSTHTNSIHEHIKYYGIGYYYYYYDFMRWGSLVENIFVEAVDVFFFYCIKSDIFFFHSNYDNNNNIYLYSSQTSFCGVYAVPPQRFRLSLALDNNRSEWRGSSTQSTIRLQMTKRYILYTYMPCVCDVRRVPWEMLIINVRLPIDLRRKWCTALIHTYIGGAFFRRSINSNAGEKGFRFSCVVIWSGLGQTMYHARTAEMKISRRLSELWCARSLA